MKQGLHDCFWGAHIGLLLDIAECICSAVLPSPPPHPPAPKVRHPPLSVFVFFFLFFFLGGGFRVFRVLEL